METTRPASPVSWRVVVVVAGVLVYSWVASGLRPFTHPEEVAVAVPIALAGIAMLRSPRDEREEDETRRGIWVWRGFLAAFLLWELISYRLSPRVDHPTLSSIADSIMSTRVGRFAMFAAWLGVGYRLFRR